MEEKLSIVIPVFNEEQTLAALLDKVIEAKISIPKEIIIVDNKSKDKSPEIAKDYAQRYPYIKYVLENEVQGKGAAVKRGFKEATGTIIIIQDADLEYDPNEYQSLINPILEGKAKVVYGSRRLKKENKQYSGFSFYLGGVAVTWATKVLYLTNITDEPTCYKVFRTDVIKNMTILGNRFEWEPEITAKVIKQGIKIYEVPISYYPRAEEEGKKIKWKDGVEAIWTLVKYRFKN